MFRLSPVSISAEVPAVYSYADTEAATAVAHANVFGVRNGFGSQGLSVRDWINCQSGCGSGQSASNWYTNFGAYENTPILELQQLSLSYPKDTTCLNGCQAGNFHYSGDLDTWLPFAWQSFATDVEIYWRDLELAFGDTGYCTLDSGGTYCTAGISLDSEITNTTQQATFFKLVGKGNGCGGSQGSHATGDCSYATTIEAAHGQH